MANLELHVRGSQQGLVLLMVFFPSELCESHLIHCHVLPAGSFMASGFSALPFAPMSTWVCSIVKQEGSIPGCTTCLVTLTFLSLCFFIFKTRVATPCWGNLMKSPRLSIWRAHTRACAHIGLRSWALELGGEREVCGTCLATLLSPNGR